MVTPGEESEAHLPNNPLPSQGPRIQRGLQKSMTIKSTQKGKVGDNTENCNCPKHLDILNA